MVAFSKHTENSGPQVLGCEPFEVETSFVLRRLSDLIVLAREMPSVEPDAMARAALETFMEEITLKEPIHD